MSPRTRRASIGTLVLSCAVYLGTCLLVSVSPTVQSLLMYSHLLRRPFPRSNLSNLASFHLEGWARQIDIRSSPNSLICGWHLLPAPAASFRRLPGAQDSAFDEQLAQLSAKVVIYFHGNALSRGFPNRVERIKLLSAHAGVHVVVIDYRGFGDSSGFPTEQGLIEDAVATYQWVVAKMDQENKHSVVLYGQSLGTGVAAALGERLVQNGDTNHLGGLVMDSAFTSMPAAAMTHPLGLPFRVIRPLGDFISRQIKDKWDSLERIGYIAEMSPSLPVLFVHGDNDMKIPMEQGMSLYDMALNRRRLAAHNEGNEDGLYFVVVPGRGHSNVQSSEVYVSAMVNFIRNSDHDHQQALGEAAPQDIALDEEGVCGLLCRMSQKLSRPLRAG